ncbi:Glycine zipper 2TM domain-containing protein [Polaromonas sp. OV174]|uniref:glycine zipper 2TM domain-containing protein n=1 Tax=Polaromonas sp. OV174 TaxID=1855300 RepID=UPI0008DF8F3F|nr:glycine zipper 2TM domain-containing protein [Polaromonas sp. OV174]SFC69015.1 Glycine zipper 2TM domain-containing protein [Polaromonas sp. OV174]
MGHASRIISFAFSGLVLAGLTACGSMPMDSGTPMPSYPASSYPTQSQYPGQYPAQYPGQYPAQNTYPAQNQQGNYVEYGRVSNIEVLQTQAQAKGSGLGAVIGGVAGAVIGHQVGGGTGKDVATVAGAVGGAVAGNAIEKNRNPNVSQAYRVTVQLDNGGARAYDFSSPGDLRIGDRVRVQNGQLFRY